MISDPFLDQMADQRRFLDRHQNRFKLGCSSDVKSFLGKLLAFITVENGKYCSSRYYNG